jgi:hypothetical protein
MKLYRSITYKDMHLLSKENLKKLYLNYAHENSLKKAW